MSKEFLQKVFIGRKLRFNASYLTVFRTAASKKPVSIAEALMKLCLVKAWSEILGSTAENEMKIMYVSNNKIAGRTDD